MRPPFRQELSRKANLLTLDPTQGPIATKAGDMLERLTNGRIKAGT